MRINQGAFALCVVSLLLQVSCSHIAHRLESPLAAPVTPQVKEPSQAELALESGLSFEEQGDYKSAEKLYRQNLSLARKMEPEIAAQMLYQMAHNLEAQGRDVEALASWLDAYRQSKDLPKASLRAEVPARIAALYSRSGNEGESTRFLREADGVLDGLLKAEKSDKPEWLPKTYYQMGQSTLNQLSVDNFEQTVDGLKTSQVYLLKALYFSESPWAEKSGEALRVQYRDLWNVLTQDRLGARRQKKMAVQVLELVESSNRYLPLEGASQLQNDFSKYLREIRERAEKIVYLNPGLIPLTTESESLNSIKRPGRIEEPNGLSSEDPNL